MLIIPIPWLSTLNGCKRATNQMYCVSMLPALWKQLHHLLVYRISNMNLHGRHPTAISSPVTTLVITHSHSSLPPSTLNSHPTWLHLVQSKKPCQSQSTLTSIMALSPDVRNQLFLIYFICCVVCRRKTFMRKELNWRLVGCVCETSPRWLEMIISMHWFKLSLFCQQQPPVSFFLFLFTPTNIFFLNHVTTTTTSQR